MHNILQSCSCCLMYKDIQPSYCYSFQNFRILCTPVHSPVVDSNLQPLRFTVVYSPVIYSSLQSCGLQSCDLLWFIQSCDLQWFIQSCDLQHESPVILTRLTLLPLSLRTAMACLWSTFSSGIPLTLITRSFIL